MQWPSCLEHHGKVQRVSPVVCPCEAAAVPFHLRFLSVPILQAGWGLIPISATDVWLVQPVRSIHGRHFHKILSFMDQSAKDTQKKLSHRWADWQSLQRNHPMCLVQCSSHCIGWGPSALTNPVMHQNWYKLLIFTHLPKTAVGLCTVHNI